VDALSLEEETRQRRELQRAFGVTPEDVARAQWQRFIWDHWSLDAPSTAGGAAPSLHRFCGLAAQELSRSAADSARLRHLAQVFRDAAEKASSTASDGTPVPGAQCSRWHGSRGGPGALYHVRERGLTGTTGARVGHVPGAAPGRGPRRDGIRLDGVLQTYRAPYAVAGAAGR